MHYAVEVPADRGREQSLEWIGGYYETGVSTKPISDVTVTQASRLTPILTAMLPCGEPKQEVVSWVVERGDGGRGFGFDGGHFNQNWNTVDFRRPKI